MYLQYVAGQVYLGSQLLRAAMTTFTLVRTPYGFALGYGVAAAIVGGRTSATSVAIGS